nr:UvrABC system protein C [Chlamydiota bacterium]
MVFDPEKLSTFPTDPGVYLMKNKEDKILYVGKANNLKQRVKQYFVFHGDGRKIVPYLTSQVEEIDIILVTSEKEALLLENNLIKKHQPKYNALLKDDKSYFSLAITHKHKWPMVRVVRYKGKPPRNQLYFGPYTKGHAAKQTLNLLRRLFPLRQCSDHELASRTRPCILYDIKKCVAPCVNKCTEDEYETLVNQVVHLLKGHDTEIVKELKKEVKEASAKLEFERADQILKTIHYIEATMETQQVEQLLAGDFDVLGIFREADEVVLTQMVYREGKLIDSYNHPFSHNAQNNDELLTSFLMQHYTDKESLPKKILLPMLLPETQTLSALLNIRLSFPKSPTLTHMAENNARAQFNREKETKDLKEKVLIELEEKCHLTNYPERIECFDNSNISGSEPVSGMVVYIKGERDRQNYRKYRIREAGPSDDYGAMKEVLSRRFKKATPLPDLIIIHGGKGHLNLAKKVLSDNDISTIERIAGAKE